MSDPVSIDPLTASSRWGVFTVKLICDTLVGADPVSGDLKPAIAESWTIASDARKVTFQLRTGVKFHNGRDLSAEDFVWSMARFAHPKTGSAQRFLLEKVAGYQELQEGKTDSLSGVRAVDSRTLEITLSAPFAELPAVLAHPSAGVAVPKEEVEKDPGAFAAKPVCTGPYSLESPWSRIEGIRLTKFAGYYASNSSYSGGGAGYADKVAGTITSDEQEAYRLLDAAGADIASIPLDRLPAARTVTGRVSSGVTGHLAYIGFPTKRAPYDNQRLRRALALAVDRSAIVQGLLEKSRKLPAGFLPPSAGKVSAASCPETIKPTPDKEGALASFTAAGADPAQLKPPIYFNAGGGHERWLEEVAQHWKAALGLETTLKPEEWRRYLDFLVDPGADGPFRLAWAVKFPSPEAVFEPLFASASLDNFTQFASGEFDALLAKARGTVDGATRTRIYTEAAMVLCREMPIIPMWYGQNHLGFARNLVRAVGPAGARVDIFGDPMVRELASSG